VTEPTTPDTTPDDAQAGKTVLADIVDGLIAAPEAATEHGTPEQLAKNRFAAATAIRRATEEAESARACERETAAELATERAAHEEHRRQLADALGEARGRNWDHLIGRAETVRADLDELRAALDGDQPADADTHCVHLRDGGCCSGPGYCAHACGDQPAKAQPDDGELTPEEARAEVERLATELYHAQDKLAFVAEMCDIADRQGRLGKPAAVSTTRIREWLKGAQCARQSGLVFTDGPVAEAVHKATAAREQAEEPRPGITNALATLLQTLDTVLRPAAEALRDALNTQDGPR